MSAGWSDLDDDALVAALRSAKRDPRASDVLELERAAAVTGSNIRLVFAVAAFALSRDRALELRRAASAASGWTTEEEWKADEPSRSELRARVQAESARRAAARPWVEKLLSACPRLAAGAILDARCCEARGDVEGSLRALRKACILASREDHSDGERALSSILRALDDDGDLAPHSPGDVHAEMLARAAASDERRAPHSLRARIASDLITSRKASPEVRSAALRMRAAERFGHAWSDAAADYEALRGCDAPATFDDAAREVTCLLAMDARDRALKLTAGVVRAARFRDEVDTARDAFLASSDLSRELGCEDFAASLAAFDETPAREAVATWIRVCHVGHITLSASGPFGPEGRATFREAVRAGHLGLAGAAARVDASLSADALEHLGLLLTFAGYGSAGRRCVDRALGAERDADRRLRLMRALGVALTWTGRAAGDVGLLQRASAILTDVLEARGGADDATLGEAHGDLAQCHAALGDQTRALHGYQAARAHLLAEIDAPTSEISDDARERKHWRRMDALLNLVVVEVELTTRRLDADGSPEDAVAILEGATSLLERVHEQARTHPPGDPVARLVRRIPGARRRARGNEVIELRALAERLQRLRPRRNVTRSE